MRCYQHWFFGGIVNAALSYVENTEVLLLMVVQDQPPVALLHPMLRQLLHASTIHVGSTLQHAALKGHITQVCQGNMPLHVPTLTANTTLLCIKLRGEGELLNILDATSALQHCSRLDALAV